MIERPGYRDFLASKRPAPRSAGINPMPMPAHLFDYQANVVAFCLRQGRAALFLDTGMGKTRCELEWCAQSAEATNDMALILTPLAVARQIEREGLALGYDVRVIRDQSEAAPGINVCNYDRLDSLDPRAFGAVALDESSILKNFTGATTRALIAAFADTPMRLCATATPAPNDHVELGNHAEFLGVMPATEMQMRWFINDSGDTGVWRLKGHAHRAFWDWVASWSRCAGDPSDLGFDTSRFVLPPLAIHRHKAQGEARTADGDLFGADVSATSMHAVKRQTAEARAEAAAALVIASPAEPWLVFCDTDYEQAAIEASIGSGFVSVRGSHPVERKEASIERWVSGGIPVLISKPSIVGAGMNFQHCARMIFVGRDFSYEKFYQSVRRCWRFGQLRPVDVHLIVAEGEDQIGRVIDRKAEDHRAMKAAMADAMRRDQADAADALTRHHPSHVAGVPAWMK